MFNFYKDVVLVYMSVFWILTMPEFILYGLCFGMQKSHHEEREYPELLFLHPCRQIHRHSEKQITAKDLLLSAAIMHATISNNQP